MANEEQADYWNGSAAQGWMRRKDAVDRMFAALTEEAIGEAGFHRGEHVLDLGCGCGSTTLAIAQRVGPEGRVTGFDLSRAMVVVASRRVREAGLQNVRFVALDVQNGDLGKAADAAFSRFGLMFFEEPVAAFRNILDGLGGGGRLHFLAWGDPARNPMFSATLGELAQRLELAPAAANAPGPFGLADPERTRRILQAAGFEEVSIEERTVTIPLPPGRQAFELLVDLSPRLGGGLDAMEPPAREELIKAVEVNLAPYAVAQGLEVPAAIHWVSAWRALEAA